MNVLVSMQKAISQFFEDVAQEKLMKTSVTAVFLLIAAPFPIATTIFGVYLHGQLPQSIIHYENLNHFYAGCIFLLVMCLLLSMIGFLLKNHQKYSEIYLYSVAQIFPVSIFFSIYSLGIFTSPVLIVVLLVAGIASLIFDKQKLLFGIFTIFIVIASVLIAQVLGILKPVPIYTNLEMVERHVFDWFISMFIIIIPASLLLFVFIVKVLNREYQERFTQLEQLAMKLSKYLSPQVYDSIFSGEKDVNVEAYRRKLSVFFSEIMGFSKSFDESDPALASDFLNAYLSEMTIVALEFGGTIDKFIFLSKLSIHSNMAN